MFNATSTQQNYSAINGIVGTSAIQIQGNTYAVTISAFSSKILIADITNPASPIVVSEKNIKCEVTVCITLSDDF